MSKNLLIGLISFIAGFAFCWNEVGDLSKKGETFTISGTPYKIIELDVVEKGASHE